MVSPWYSTSISWSSMPNIFSDRTIMLASFCGFRRWSKSLASHNWKLTTVSFRTVPPQSMKFLVIRPTSVTWKCSGTKVPLGNWKVTFSSVERTFLIFDSFIFKVLRLFSVKLFLIVVSDFVCPIPKGRQNQRVLGYIIFNCVFFLRFLKQVQLNFFSRKDAKTPSLEDAKNPFATLREIKYYLRALFIFNNIVFFYPPNASAPIEKSLLFY